MSKSSKNLFTIVGLTLGCCGIGMSVILLGYILQVAFLDEYSFSLPRFLILAISSVVFLIVGKKAYKNIKQ